MVNIGVDFLYFAHVFPLDATRYGAVIPLLQYRETKLVILTLKRAVSLYHVLHKVVTSTYLIDHAKNTLRPFEFPLFIYYFV